MSRTILLVATCCAILCVLGVVAGGRWLVANWDRIPNEVGDSYDNWRRGLSVPWPGGGPAPTSDGGTIAYSSPRSGRGDIYVWDRATGGSRQLTGNDDFEGQPAFSPDNERIAYQRQEPEYGRWRIWIMNADGSQQRPISNPLRGNDSYPQFTPDGKRVRFLRSTWQGGGQRVEYVEVDLATGTETPTGGYGADQVADEGTIWKVGATSDGRVWARKQNNGGRHVIGEGYYPLLVNNEADVLYAGQYARGLWLVGTDGENRRQVFDNPGYILMQPRRHGGSNVVFILDALGSGRALELWEVDTMTETSRRLTRVD